MAKDTEKTSDEAEPSAEAQAAQQRARQQLELDVSGAVTSYANFCRVTGTPEELIIDLGLNSQPMGIPNEPIKVDQRLILNFYTAKRMLAALSMSIQRHEQAFGVLETDVQKRVVPGLRQAQSSPPPQA